MGPQLKGCGRVAICRLPTVDSMLQWGRSLRAAEGGLDGRVVVDQPIASMGPQLKGCGRLASVKGPTRRSALQWGRSLRAAEGRRGQRSGRPRARFNGAAA